MAIDAVPVEAKSSGTPESPEGSAPLPTGSTGPGKQRELSDKEIKALLKDYFSRKYDENVRQYLAAEATTRFTRWVIGLAGAAIFAAPFIKVILTEETDRQLIGQLEGQLFLLPGFLLLMIAAISPLWSRGWPFPMALSIGVAALDLYVFQVGHVWIIYALLALASAVLFWDIRSFLGEREKPKSVKEFEVHIDHWTDQQLRNLIEMARADLPIGSGRLNGNQTLLLKSFPKTNRLDREACMARIGTDGVPRMSPVGLAAFDFGDKDVLVFEGAVDLNTTRAVYMRLHQFSYDSISSINWSSDAWPPETAGGKSSPAEGPTPSGTGQVTGKGHTVMVRKDALEIRLKGQHDVSIVFRDGSLAERLEDKPFKPVEKIEKIKEVWDKFSQLSR